MFDKNSLVPNWNFIDASGDSHALWDFRQKSHVVLIYDPKVTDTTLAQWRTAIHLDRAQWDWLRVSFFILKTAPEGLEPGVFMIDRYSRFLNHFPLDRWSFDDLEREFIYYEARHC